MKKIFLSPLTSFKNFIHIGLVGMVLSVFIFVFWQVSLAQSSLTTNALNTATQNSSVPNNTTSAASKPIIMPTAILIEPQNSSLYTGDKIYFKALSDGIVLKNITWSVVEEEGGSVTSNGYYIAPNTAGVFHVIAKSANTNLKPGIVNIFVKSKDKLATTTASAIFTNTSASVALPTSTLLNKIATSSRNITATSTPVIIIGPKDLTASTNQSTGTAGTSNSPKPVEKVINVTSAVDSVNSLRYEDSNKDGISDYDSVYIYKIDPVKPTPMTTYQGRQINAGEKILLGFDPAKENLVKVTPEEPMFSLVQATSTFKVKEVILNPEKKVTIKGQAMPNSFVTVYVYSTPIVVTVKTNSDGEWQYTLDEELENGRHTLYTATVNNSGKIVAKSSPFTFTKTAEAAALEMLPPVQFSNENIKPSIWSGKYVYTIIGLFVLMSFLALVLIGVSGRKNNTA